MVPLIPALRTAAEIDRRLHPVEQRTLRAQGLRLDQSQALYNIAQTQQSPHSMADLGGKASLLLGLAAYLLQYLLSAFNWAHWRQISFALSEVSCGSVFLKTGKPLNFSSRTALCGYLA